MLVLVVGWCRALQGGQLATDHADALRLGVRLLRCRWTRCARAGARAERSDDHEDGQEEEGESERDDGHEREDGAKLAERQQLRPQQRHHRAERGDGGGRDRLATGEDGGARLVVTVGEHRVLVGVRQVDDVVDRHT
eukprot:scaffold82480_cov61-Phaeocystis_antarctica.AAC.1